ncbi:unnamed protein product [Bursaphelenchus xylophilus]|uniref:Amino acid transporter n=1 Tax=Bursaphelenchus xylophilus TaxID=6326 RepID=A0A1I7RHB0_BURXY|nr:unnamed protein product [Bursaphelenchus xylophilus]CAG9115884.1 unnamed protein product [Bursaphelenchus xylophilus]
MARIGIRRLKCGKCVGFCQKNLLLTLTINAVIIGLALGFLLRGLSPTEEAIQLINFPGEIFLQILKLMILPLIFSSLISALAQLDAKSAGQMGMMTVGYYLLTVVLSTITGIILVLAIHPGHPEANPGSNTYIASEHQAVSPLDTFLDVVRNMFPENVIQATFQRVQTSYYEQKPKTQRANITNAIIKKKIEYAEGMNILGIIMFCSGFGIIISQFGEKARIIIDFFIILEAVIMKLVDVFMWFAPLGIICLIAGNILELEDLSDTAQLLLMYVITVLGGLTIHTILTMPLLYFLLTRKNPLTVCNGMIQALVTAFGTASGGAALPVSMQCMEDNLKVDRRITRFVLPLGSTINMDGNALYEAVAVIFIAQLNGVELTIAEVITVSLISTIASLGLNSVPAGLVSILVILKTVDLPTKDVSLLITVDWLIDRVRTSINVLGDAFTASIVSHYLQKELDKADEFNEFHQQLTQEALLLKSAANSRKGSFSKFIETPMLSTRNSRRPSIDVMSWREQDLLNKLSSQVALPLVKHL